MDKDLVNTASENQDSVQESVIHSNEPDAARVKARKKVRRRRIWKRILTGFMVIMVGIYMAVGVFGLKYAMKMLETKPELNIGDFISEESSKIYDAHGTLITEIGTYFRENIQYEDCPESLIDAFLSIEDSRYFEHNGFDIPRFSKAAIETLIRHNTQGGSTFTMQLVKNTYFSIDAGDESVERDATIEYKVQQIVLAMELEQYLNKEDIFELYLNRLNFGARIRGVEKAAEYYFGKDTSELTLSESAMLAGIVNLPNLYNPYEYLDYATERRNDVLYQMYNHGYISEDEYKLACSIRIEDQLVGEDELNVESTEYGEYVDVVIEEAIEMTGLDPVSRGMEIYTALEPEVQDTIEAIEAGETDVWFTQDLMQVAMISMNNQNGEIIGIGGGRNYEGGARLLSRATSAPHQPGSSVKPWLSYALGFEYLGYSMDEVLCDRPITYPGESRVLNNATGTYFGDVTIKKAISWSLNIPAITTLQRVEEKVGSDVIIQYLQSMNIQAAYNYDFHLSFAIGSNNFTMTTLELAGAHATMINLGVYNKPHTIRKIELTNGDIYYPEGQNVRVLSSGSAYLVDQLMQYNVDCQVLNNMQVLKRSYPVYAKTGTSDWGSDGEQYGIPYGAMKDSWMVASTSNYTNAVWLGYDMAVAYEHCYLENWENSLNINGRTLINLLDAEENLDGDISGVSAPDDLENVTYVYGSWPHVQAESWMPSSKLVTSLESSAGLRNSPLIAASEYDVGTSKPVMGTLNASVSGTTVSINWRESGGCSGGVKDISLHDGYNNISKTGACLADLSFLKSGGGGNYYGADIYENGVFITSVSSTSGSYSGDPGGLSDGGSIRVCAWYSNANGTSNTVCTDAGTYTVEKKEEEEEKPESSGSESGSGSGSDSGSGSGSGSSDSGSSGDAGGSSDAGSGSSDAGSGSSDAGSGSSDAGSGSSDSGSQGE